MSKFVNFFQEINPTVLIGSLMTPMVAILLAAVNSLFNYQYVFSVQITSAMNTALAMFISYLAAFIYTKWRTSWIESGCI